MLTKAKIISIFILGVLVFLFFVFRSNTAPDWTDLPKYVSPSTVVLIPGYGGGIEGFSKLTEMLTTENVSYEILDIGDGHGDINGYARQLVDVSEKMDGPVTWVGFSMGGLIARLAYTAEISNKVGSIVSISAPLQGTDLASFAAFKNMCDLACAQMKPSSSVIDTVNKPLIIPVRWLTIFSPNDEVIRPYISSENAQAVNLNLNNCNLVTLPTHSQMLDNSFVLTTVTGFIKSGNVEMC